MQFAMIFFSKILLDLFFGRYYDIIDIYDLN